MKALYQFGGSVKGSWSCGVLKHLLGDLKINYDFLGGVSVGSLNAVHLAHYKSGQEQKAIDDLINLWRNLTTDKIYKHWFPFGRLSLWKPSLYDSTPLINLIKKIVKPDLIKASGKKLRISAVSLTTGKSRVFDETYHDLAGACLGSASLPGIFLPILLENEYWVDGAITNGSLIKHAIQAGADKIDIIMTSPAGIKQEHKSEHNIFSILPRLINIVHEPIIENDLLQTIKINNIIKNGGYIPGKKFIDIKVIRPEVDLEVSLLDFNQKTVSSLIELGYKTAINSYSHG